jgi:hypothetical protein
VQAPAPPARATHAPAPARSLKDLPTADQQRVREKLQALHLLEDWERERFMALSVLKGLTEEREQVIAMLSDLGLAPLPKIVAEKEFLAKRKADLLAEIQATLKIPGYQARVRKQITADIQEIKTRGKDSPEVAPLIARLRITKQEADSWKK